jgi:hypothetical protein
MASLDSSSVAFKLNQRGRNFKLLVYVSTTKSRGTLLGILPGDAIVAAAASAAQHHV